MMLTHKYPKRVGWTDAELKWMRESYASSCRRETIAALPRHTYGSICKKAEQLGVQKVGRKSGEWTHWLAWEQEWLLENWNLYSYAKDIGKMLPRHTPSAIVKRAEKLGLPRHENCHQRGRGVVEIWWELQASGPCTCTDLTAVLKRNPSVVWKAIKDFHEAKVIYVDSWVKRGTKWVAVWAAGDGCGRKKPPNNGRRHAHVQKLRIKQYQGNPFRDLLIGAAHDNAKREEDVCP